MFTDDQLSDEGTVGQAGFDGELREDGLFRPTEWNRNDFASDTHKKTQSPKERSHCQLQATWAP